MENNKKTVNIIIFVSLLFLSIILYLTYIQIFKADTMAKNSYNKRQWAKEDNTIRGSIYDRNGISLAETQINKDSTMTRLYNYGDLYSHVIGYSSKKYGKAGLESYYNNELLGLGGENILDMIRESISGESTKGNELTLTLDHDLQEKAGILLKGKTGSIVALNPKTGEVLVMVSKPDYNPNKLSDQWESLVENQTSPLLNRSLSGLYAPGSSYKPIIAAAVLENNIDSNYDCTGSIIVDGYELRDSNKKGHGNINLRQSLLLSCNTNFARMGVELGSSKVTEISKRFFINRKIESHMPIAMSRYPYKGKIGDTDLAAISIGQGKLLVTPIHMATIAATFANKGLMMTPYIVEEISNSKGKIIDSGKEIENEIISESVAEEIKEMMIDAVNEGTGWRAKISGLEVGGKTGTAQNETGESHAWFIGFASQGDSDLAIAVILESEGKSGGEAAAPIARQVISQWIKGGY